MEIPKNVASELVTMVWMSGMAESLSPETKQFISQDEIAALLNLNETPNLEPRLTLDEYLKYIPTHLDAPKQQLEFYTIIIRIVYFMLLIEKNPLAAQELRGLSSFTNQLKSIFK